MQKLYVISSLHYGPDPEVNEREGVEGVLAVKLPLIRALAATVREGLYFSDGLYQRVVDSSSPNEHLVCKNL